MNKQFLLTLCFALLCNIAVAQQSPNVTEQKFADDKGLMCYMCASASSGVLKSAAMTVKQDGGKREELENGDFVLILKRGDFVEFGFSLPETANNVKATIKYRSDSKTDHCFIRWNDNNPKESGLTDPKPKEKLYYKIYDLKDSKRNNLLRITGEGAEGLKFYDVIITYNYTKPSSNKPSPDPTDNFIVTLDSPDPAKSIEDVNVMEFKWSGTGNTPKEGGWITLQFCDNDNNIWKTVPGAEFIPLGSEYWKNPESGSFIWKNHKLTQMPDMRIVFAKGETPVKKVERLCKEKIYNEALYNINQTLEKFPQNEDFKKLRIDILRKINPFDIECRKTGCDTTVKVNNMSFKFVYIKQSGSKGFWILNQEVSQDQWRAIVKDNPSKHQGNRYPAENISWDKCRLFCVFFLNKLENSYPELKRKINVDIPTKSQWEAACKPVNENQIHCNRNWYGSPDTIGVTDKPCNKLGIYGMQGNVAEWCLDGKDASIKFVCGGSCYDRVDKCQPNSSVEKKHDDRDGYTGFRFVIIPK